MSHSAAVDLRDRRRQDDAVAPKIVQVQRPTSVLEEMRLLGGSPRCGLAVLDKLVVKRQVVAP
jgi:hypothetical protein